MITHGTFTGTAPIALTASGLPDGVTFTDNWDGTFTLTGTWPAPGTYSYDVTGTNVAGSDTVAGNQLIVTAAGPAIPSALGDSVCIAEPSGTVNYLIYFVSGGSLVATGESGLLWHNGDITESDYSVRFTGFAAPDGKASGVLYPLPAIFEWTKSTGGWKNINGTLEIVRNSDSAVVSSATVGKISLGIGRICP